jgi:hypothetical protein
MDELMDSDGETMFAAPMEEEAQIAAADDEEHLMMLSCLMASYYNIPTYRIQEKGSFKSMIYISVL